jgi:DNA-directed RNA polymerase subunit N (RpoN/RPB10)
MILNFINPIFIYFKNKRLSDSNEINFNSEILYNKFPAFINALWGKGFKKLGETNVDGFLTTLLDLINRGYIDYKILEDSKKDSENPIYIILNIYKRKVASKNSNLKEYEKNIISCLNVFENKGTIDFRNFKDVFNKRVKAKIFQKNYRLWRENSYKELLDKDSIERYCSRKNVSYHRTHGKIALILSFLNFAMFFLEISFFYLTITIIFGIVLGILGLTLIYLPEKYLVKWTTEGKEIYKQCILLEKLVKKNLKAENFLKDEVSLNKLLIYGTALGFKKSSKKTYFMSNSKESRNERNMFSSDNIPHGFILNYFLSHGGILLLHEAIERGVVVDTFFSDYRDSYNENQGYWSRRGDYGGGGSGGGSGESPCGRRRCLRPPRARSGRPAR